MATKVNASDTGSPAGCVVSFHESTENMRAQLTYVESPVAKEKLETRRGAIGADPRAALSPFFINLTFTVNPLLQNLAHCSPPDQPSLV